MKTTFMKTLAVALALLAVGAVSAQAQNRTVRGTVSEVTENGKVPVIGAGVLIKGTTRGGTATDLKGQYTITVPAGQNTLLFTSVGYKDLEVEIGGRGVIDVTLEPDADLLDEVVVVGYGVQRRSDVSGSVTSIKAEELAASPATNITEMMRGRAAGVQVTLSSGAPGATSNIQIRGIRSVKDNSNTPMYVVDGIITTDTEFNAIAPDDVESLEILKDAASQAIYGARAANGVIIVTTKRGTKEKATVTFTSSISSQHLWRNFDFYNADEYFELRRQAIAHDKGIDNPKEIEALTVDEVLTDEMMKASYMSGKFTDWEKLMLSPALIQKYDLSVRGGTDKVKVSASAGYMHHKGMVNIGSRFTRGNLRVNLDWEARKWLTLGFSNNYIKQQNLGAPESFSSYITMSPLGVPFDEEGNPTKYINVEMSRNPLYNAQYYRSQTDTDIARLNTYIDIHPLKGLSYRFNFGYYNRFQEKGSYKTKDYFGGGSAGSITDSKFFKYQLENIITYQVPFTNKDFRLNLTVAHTYEHQPQSSLGFGANNVPVDSFWWHMIQDGENTDQTHTFTELFIISYLARAQFAYKDRYMVNAAFRRDGCSRFGAGRKWGTFPSISAAWRINQEPWMKGIKEISNLKFRASYGAVGNMNGIGNYETLGTVSDAEYEFATNDGSVYIHGYTPGSALPNKNLHWESTKSANVAVDFGFFKNRLNGTIEHYNTRTDGLLFTRRINSALGYTSMTDNIAKTKTSGWDINIDGAIIRKRDIEWTAGIVFSQFDNRIVRLSGDLDEDGKPIDDKANGWFIGQPINVYYTYRTNGIYQYDDFDLNVYKDTGAWVLKDLVFDSDGDGVADSPLKRSDIVEPGSVKVVDYNKDGKIDENDRQVIPTDPKFVGSFNMGFRYKNFNIYMDWYGVYGAMKQNKWLYDYDSGGSLAGKLNGIKVDYWTPTNPSNEAPRPLSIQGISYHQQSSLRDASYLRLRTLSVGYTFGPKVLNALKLKSAKLTLAATNLLTFTEYLSYSPETSPGTYPEPRQYNATFTVSF